jgi:hypothetical protein
VFRSTSRRVVIAPVKGVLFRDEGADVLVSDSPADFCFFFTLRSCPPLHSGDRLGIDLLKRVRAFDAASSFPFRA